MQSGGSGSARRFPTSWVLRVVGSLVVLGLTFWLLPSDIIWSALRNISLGPWLAALAALFLGHVVVALKWRLLASDGNDIPIATALRAHAGGIAASLFLPGVAGGDVVRVAVVMRAAKNRPHVVVGSFTERLIDTFALLFLASVGGAVSAVGGEAFSLLAQASILIGGGVLAGIALLVGLHFVPNLPFAGLRKLSEVVVEFGKRPGRLALCFGLSVTVQAWFILAGVYLAENVGAHATLGAWFFAWPLAKIIAVLPVSIGGLGVREAALASLMTPFGASAATIVGASLAWQSAYFVGAILAGLIFMLTPRKDDRQRTEPVADRHPAR